MDKVEKQFERIRSIEDKLYEGIRYRQEQMNRQLIENEKKRECEKKRYQEIKQKNMKEQVTHPYNGGIWVYLANCLDEDKATDLDEIKERQMKRKEIQQEIQKKKLSEVAEIQDVKEKKNSKKVEKEQIPWKLMRQLRKHDVQENKKRIEKAKEYQQHYKKKYHN